jgi:HAD superfamily hydrolase (TIGR01509 family)
MKVIFFDFFGVLSSPIYNQIIDRHLPLPERPVWIKKLDLLDLGIVPEADFVKLLSERTNLPEERIWQEADAAPRFNEDLFTFIQHELKGSYTVGILTNVPRSLIERIAGDRLPLFDTVIISSDVKLIKPDPRMFALAIQKAGCDPQDILFIDDRHANVEAAQAAGLKALTYTDFPTFKSEFKELLHTA